MTATKAGTGLRTIFMVGTLIWLTPFAGGFAVLNEMRPVVTADSKTGWIRQTFAYHDVAVTLRVPAGGLPPPLPERNGMTSFISPYVLWRAYGTTQGYEPRFLLTSLFFGRESGTPVPVTAPDMTEEGLRIGDRVAAETGFKPDGQKMFASSQWQALDVGQRRWFLTNPSGNHDYVAAMTVASDRWLLMISGQAADRSQRNKDEYRKVLEKVLSTVEISTVNK